MRDGRGLLGRRERRYAGPSGQQTAWLARRAHVLVAHSVRWRRCCRAALAAPFSSSAAGGRRTPLSFLPPFPSLPRSPALDAGLAGWLLLALLRLPSLLLALSPPFFETLGESASEP